MKMKTVAILYATKGGMGDVGKFAITLAGLDKPPLPCNIQPIALSIENSSEGTDKGLEVDVEDLQLNEKTEKILGTMDKSILKIDVSKDSAEAEIKDALDGVDAVVSCLGNRQPKMERWCSLGTRKVVSAMKAKNIQRLVSLSSMGIGEDLLRTTPLTMLWAVLLRTLLRSARKDLIEMEREVSESNLDYVLVRPVGLTPSEPPQGSCDQLLSKSDGELKFMLSKSDAAAFMLREALAPTIHGRAVTIGYSTSRSTSS
jgi:putative NADH-flavin reductase